MAECMWDGQDCDHAHSECYHLPHGEDYRGSVNVTASGHPCQKWSSQFPQQHFFTHARYPAAGLGAHSACRNPGGINDGVWCYTSDHRQRWERCTVGEPESHPSCAASVATASGTADKGPTHRLPTKARVPACERLCPLTFALVTKRSECEALEDCNCDGEACAPADAAAAALNASFVFGTDPCMHERATCTAHRLQRERLLLVLWLSLAGTSLFVMGLVVHAYRLTSPLGSPRSFAAAGYTGINFATPGTALDCTVAPGSMVHDFDMTLDSPKPKLDIERRTRESREHELLEAERSVLIE